jgi:hypothetical protein
LLEVTKKPSALAIRARVYPTTNHWIEHVAMVGSAGMAALRLLRFQAWPLYAMPS